MMVDYFEEDQKNTADRAEWLEMQRIGRESQQVLEKKVEVKLTRINTNQTQVEFSMGTHQLKWYSDLPVDDFRCLFDIYQHIPHEGLNSDPVQFVFDINNRIYAEWCMSPGEGLGQWHRHSNYQGEGFTSFMDKEVYYELERQRSEGDRGSHEGYLRARQRVLGGLTLKAVDLFSEWNGTFPSSRAEKDDRGVLRYIYDDKRNLRGKEGLNDYILRYCQLREQQLQSQAA